MPADAYRMFGSSAELWVIYCFPFFLPSRDLTHHDALNATLEAIKKHLAWAVGMTVTSLCGVGAVVGLPIEDGEVHATQAGPGQALPLHVVSYT